MDVVSPELNSLLPDEIMDTEDIEDVPHSQPGATAVHSEPSDDASVPMETDTPVASENVSLCSDATLTEPTKAMTTSTATDSMLSASPRSPPPVSNSSTSSPLLTIKPALATSTATTKTTDSVTGTSVTTSGLQKLTTPFTISPANRQIILNKVASQASEAAKSAGNPPQVIKQDGQKLLVTAIGKSGQPIVLQLPHTGSKPGISQTAGDTKSQAPQFKVVTIGGRSDLKPVVGNQVTTLQTQQLKTVQVTITFCIIHTFLQKYWLSCSTCYC